MQYRLIKYLDGNNKEMWKVKQHSWFGWFYLKDYVGWVSEYPSRSAALNAAQRDADKRRGWKYNAVSDSEVML